jgi:hypothetical protein
LLILIKNIDKQWEADYGKLIEVKSFPIPWIKSHFAVLMATSQRKASLLSCLKILLFFP